MLANVTDQQSTTLIEDWCTKVELPVWFVSRDFVTEHGQLFAAAQLIAATDRERAIGIWEAAIRING